MKRYVRATGQEPYYRGGYTRQYDCHYIVCFNCGGTGKRYTNLADAKYALRKMIDSTVKRYGTDSVDLEDCFIVEELSNGETGRTAYLAVNDPYFNAYRESDL
jgi:hypothetical protein